MQIQLSLLISRVLSLVDLFWPQLTINKNMRQKRWQRVPVHQDNIKGLFGVRPSFDAHCNRCKFNAMQLGWHVDTIAA